MNIEKVIDDLIDQTEIISSNSAMLTVPAAKTLIKVGPDAVPALLRRLKTEPSFGVVALLEAITGRNPVPVKARGRLDQAARAWLR